jgi:hypothetical protein
MSDSPNYMAQAEAIFRRMLSGGKPIAFEDAARCVATPESVDRRCFGSIPVRLRRDGLIVEAGFRRSQVGKAHKAPKRLWVLADAVKGGAQ